VTSAKTSITRQESCNPALVRRIAAMLDLPSDGLSPGDPLPRGWQFFLMGADTRRSKLRGDGFPGLGVPMPDLDLPRLVLGGRTVAFHLEIPIGVDVVRSSTVHNVEHKSTDNGPMAIVTLKHELHVPGAPGPALVETQTYLLRSRASVSGPWRDAAGGEPVAAQYLSTFVPDETLLFQYSALGFNSHKIHIDREHARDVEGFPDLVVNGGLATLLLTEFLRRELDVTPAAIKTRHVTPLFCNRAITLAADRIGEAWKLRAFDSDNRLAIDMEVSAQ